MLTALEVDEVDEYDLRDAGEEPWPRYNPPPEKAMLATVPLSLDPEPKNPEEPPAKLKNDNYVFRNHLKTHERVNHWLLTRCPDERLRQRVSACGSEAWIDESPSSGRFRLRCKRCGWRACPLCRVRWALGVREKIESVVAEVTPGRRKLATLTLRSSSAPLKEQVLRIWQCFARLRQRSVWKKAVNGSIAVLEVTFNEKTKQWHPHLHIVLDAQFLDQKQLSKQWLQITLTSKIVDVRALKSFSSAAKYLTKYLLKTPTLPKTVDQKHEDELYGLYRKARIVRFQGSLRPRKDEEIWRPDYPKDWTPMMPLEELLNRIDRGDPRAREIMAMLSQERSFQRHEPEAPAFPP